MNNLNISLDIKRYVNSICFVASCIKQDMVWTTGESRFDSGQHGYFSLLPSVWSDSEIHPASYIKCI